MNTAPVTFTGVTKQFNPAVRGLDDVTVSFAPNKVTVLLGLSGSGKSTLLRHVNGLQRPTSGTIQTLGVGVETRWSSEGSPWPSSPPRWRRPNAPARVGCSRSQGRRT